MPLPKTYIKMLRKLPLMIWIALCFSATYAQAKDEMGLKEAYEEADYRFRLRAEEGAQRANARRTVPEGLSEHEQLKYVRAFSKDVLQADSQRKRLRAHADLVVNADRLLQGLQAAAHDRNVDPIERSVAIWALGERGTIQACDALINAVEETSNPLYTLTIATANGRCGDVRGLRDVLTNGTDMTSARAAVTIGMLGADRFLGNIKDRQKEVQGTKYESWFDLARGLLGDASVVESLEKMINDRELHLHAAIALGRMGKDYVVFDVRAAALSPETLVRWAATNLIVQQRIPGACEVLRTMEYDPDNRIAQMSQGVVDDWRHTEELRWRSEGFAMSNFNENAYCP